MVTGISSIILFSFLAIVAALVWLLIREGSKRRQAEARATTLALEQQRTSAELSASVKRLKEDGEHSAGLAERLRDAESSLERVRTELERETLAARLAQESLSSQNNALSLGDIGIWEWRPEANVCHFDSRACRLFNLEQPPRCYEDWIHCILHPDRPAFEAALRGALLGYGPVEIRTRAGLRNEEPRNLLLRGQVKRNESGDPTSIVGLVRDISDEISLKEKHRLADERLRFALMGANDGIWEWQAPDDLFVMDERWLALCGSEDDEGALTRSELEKRLHPEDLGLFRAALRAQRLKGAAMLDLECRVAKPSGEWAWLRWRGAVMSRDREGDIQSLCGTYSDVTERHRSEQELRRSTLLLRQVCQQMGIAALQIDAASLALQWTEELDLLHSAPPDFIPSVESLLALYPADSRREITRCLETCLEKQAPFDIEVRWLPPGQVSPRWYRWTGHPVSDSGRVLAVCGLVQDVSAAHETANQRRELDGRMAELRQYEALSAATDDLAYDINSILGSLMGYQELAFDELPLGHKARPYVLEAIKAAERTHEIMKQVLLLNRVRPTSRIGLLPHLIIEEICDRLSSMLGEAILIDRDIDRQCPLVQGDAAQLQQSFMSIACQGTSAVMGHRGHLCVGLRTEHVSIELASSLGLTMSGEFMVFSLSVLEPKLEEHNWVSLYTEPSHDPGMQLSSSRKIIREHHGVVELTHDPEKGCRCQVWLPLLRTIQIHPPASTPVPDGEGERVWIVDEERFVSRLAKLCLENKGYTVTRFATASEMLSAFQAAPDTCSAIILATPRASAEPADLALTLRSLRPRLALVRIGRQVPGSPFVGLEEPFTAADLARAVYSALHPEENSVRILGSNSAPPFAE